MDLKRAKDTANSFWQSAARCLEQRRISPTHFNMPIVPGVVCAAFSIELGLKTLIGGSSTPPKSHNLEKLFSLVPANTQDQIVAGCASTRASFDASLSLVANAFEDWRYIYEQETVQLDMAFLQRLSDAVYSIINGLPPNNSFKPNPLRGSA